MNWLPYQRRFLKAAASDRWLTSALSIPRGGGKTTLAGHLVARALTPGDALYADGGEVVLFSGSIEQCRLVYRQALQFLDSRIGEYRLTDSATRVAITRKACRTRLKAVGSNPKTSLGLVGVPLAVLDEPAALHETGGGALWDAVITAQGKVSSQLKVLAIGTIAPASEGNWWPRLVGRGTWGSTYVQLLQGRREKWDQWREITRVNPLARHFPELADKLREERLEAQQDERLKARFLSYRLNLPSGDETTMLLSLPDWERVLSRPVADRGGELPTVGIDLGQGRAWSAAVAAWPSGRVEAFAVAPGIPSIEAQEKRDRVPAATYRELHQSGQLLVAEGLRVPPAEQLVEEAYRRWGPPLAVVADRFREGELRDAAPYAPIEPRVSRWSESSADIRALRKFAKDGPLSVEEGSRLLLSASLSAATVKTDDGGSVRLTKSKHNTARDDVAAALVLVLVLAAGYLSRQPKSTGPVILRACDLVA